MWSNIIPSVSWILVFCNNFMPDVETKSIDITRQSNMNQSQFEHDFIETEKRTIEEIAEHVHDPENGDLKLNISELLYKYGYGFEDHEVTTADGYVLSLHRIPSRGKAVLLVHGILMSSDSWVISGPEHGLPFVLAAEGYDVWMFNARGNVHSRKHKFLKPTSKKFWNFSWDEIGRYDLPASIDYILDLKGHKQLSYVGFSQGTTTFFVMCSEIPEYNEKISIMVSLSTVTWMSNLYSPTLRLCLKLGLFHSLTVNKYELMPLSEGYSTLCNENSVSKFLCANVFYAMFGFDLGQLNVTNLPMIFRHVPAGSSIKQYTHYEQLIYLGKFRKFDYGHEGNLKMYGEKEPPKYKVKKVTAPIALFHSDSDWFSNKTDVLVLTNKLSNVVDFHIVETAFNHIDYIFGKDARKFVYSRIVDLLRKFS